MRLLRQNIDTHLGLGHPEQNSEEHYRLAKKRAVSTIRFIKAQGIEPHTMIDIAGPSKVGQWIADGLKCSYLDGTVGDLDAEWWAGLYSCDLVLMTEVIEHLFNPLKFLVELRDKVKFRDMIVTWPARPSWLWCNGHFHEMRRDRFELLCKTAGYTIVTVKKGRSAESWYNRFRGIRPFFRSFVNVHYMAHLR